MEVSRFSGDSLLNGSTGIENRKPSCGLEIENRKPQFHEKPVVYREKLLEKTHYQNEADSFRHTRTVS